MTAAKSAAPSTIVIWNVAQLEREVKDGCVLTVHYTVDAKDDVYSAGAYGAIGLERPESGLIPFSELTPELVMSWVKDALGEEKVAEVEAALLQQLSEQRQPTKAAGLPWAS
jgi:hypothetical protein